jgi:DNA-binding transcriptional regulator LsrR (DeoR family)
VKSSKSSVFNRSLMHSAATLHYLDGLTQLEVSRKLQVSTATISRLLARARDEGIVRIEVADLEEIDGTGDRLRVALGLKKVRVVDVPESGMAAGMSFQVNALLREASLHQGSVIAIGWGRTVQSMITAGLPRFPGVSVVPAMGGLHETASHFQINEFVRQAAEQLQGRACLLHAPSLPSAELRAVLLADPETARIAAMWRRIDAAILGIGDFRTAKANRDIVMGSPEAGRVVGDVIRHYFDETGCEIGWPGHDDLMAVSIDELRRVPLSIGIAFGREKLRAIIGACRSRLINMLVTDARTARLILDRLRNAAP